MDTIKMQPINTSQYDTQPILRQVERKRISPAAFWISLGALLVILPLILMMLAIVLFQVQQLNLPGVMIFDHEVGWMTSTTTATWVDSLWNQNRNIQLSVSDDPQINYVLTPAELGLWVDADATARAANAVGRAANPFADIFQAITGTPQRILPILYFDEDAARSTLETLSDEIDITPQNAKVALQDGAWIAVPGSDGRAVDVESALKDLSENGFTILIANAMTLQLNPLPSDIADLSPVLEEIDALLQQDLKFTAYDPITDETLSWSVPQEVKTAWVHVNPETQTVQYAFDPDAIHELIQSWEAELGERRTFSELPGDDKLINRWENSQRVNVIIRHAPTTYRVMAGESLWSVSLKLGIPMWYILDANEGLTINNLSAGMSLTIPSKNDLLPLPVVPTKRIVIDIGEQSMTVYENGEIWDEFIVSTGVSDSPTMAGIFQVRTHEINAYASNWDLWMPHFMGIYEAWPGFMNGIHGLPLLSNGQRLWANALGRPASYGCIILDLAAAEALYYWAEAGVVVEITN